MQITTVIFDVDGTLVDTNWMHAESWAKTFKKFGVEVPKEEILPLIGTGGEKITKRFFTPEQAGEFSQAAIKAHSENISGIAERARVFPKVRELFQELKKRGKKIVLATSAQRVIVDSHIENMAVRDLIDDVVSASEVERTKPDPDIFLKALEKSKIDALQAIVVGDTIWDVIAAKKAGLRVVCVLTGGSSEKQLRQAGAVEVYEDVADLFANLDKSAIK